MIEKEQTNADGHDDTPAENRPADDPKRDLTPEARRALEEAAQRRVAGDKSKSEAGKGPKELGGQDGPEPTRYGDWEKGGIISDF